MYADLPARSDKDSHATYQVLQPHYNLGLGVDEGHQGSSRLTVVGQKYVPSTLAAVV